MLINFKIGFTWSMKGNKRNSLWVQIVALNNQDNLFHFNLQKTWHTSGGVIEPTIHHNLPRGLFHFLYPSRSSVLSASFRSWWREAQQGNEEIRSDTKWDPWLSQVNYCLSWSTLGLIKTQLLTESTSSQLLSSLMTNWLQCKEKSIL